MQLDYNTPINAVTKYNIKTAKIFEEYDLDFCCVGKKSIAKACSEKGIDADNLIKELNIVINNESDGTHYEDWNLNFLIDYIRNNHHSYVRSSIVSIDHHFSKVVNKHGITYPEILKAVKLFDDIKLDLLSHMDKEEKMLFPYIKKMMFAAENNVELQIPPFGSIKNPINVMEEEHQSAGDEMSELKKITNNYTPPDNACNTFKLLYSELNDFEKDLHIHVHLENNILFPKAITFEDNIMCKSEGLNNLYTSINETV